YYCVGIDGISLFLVLLTTFLMPIVILTSWSIKKGVRGYVFNMLVLETAIIGALCALDLFLFYVFWELMLFPMYFIIGIWGGKRKIYASLKFVLYTVVGSLAMLLGIFYLVWHSGADKPSFLLEDLLKSNLDIYQQIILFWAFTLAFIIKVPVFPFHTWLPDAHVEAPTGGSVVLAGILLKMGLYGLIRFAFPLFPEAAQSFVPLLALLALIGIIYGALVAWAQQDIKKLVAYSSVSHLGYCVLGFVALNEAGVVGSIYQMLNHGISTGALFLLVGVLYDRRHTRLISEYGGLTSKVPLFAFMLLVFTLSSIALPLTNGFVGEFLILSGAVKALPLFGIIAVSGVILGAVYMLHLYLRVMFGPLNEEKNGSLTDMDKREVASLLPLLVMVFIMGVYPKPFIGRIKPSVKTYIKSLKEVKKRKIVSPNGGVIQIVDKKERVSKKAGG
ncbi:MAG: NADH-quinone oxidoreductase subunit M, partial [Candidatus Dadabacteria bacterium]